MTRVLGEAGGGRGGVLKTSPAPPGPGLQEGGSAAVGAAPAALKAVTRGALAVEENLEVLAIHVLGELGDAVPVLAEDRLAGLGLLGGDLALQVLGKGSHPASDQLDLFMTGVGLEGPGEGAPVHMAHLYGRGRCGVGVLEGADLELRAQKIWSRPGLLLGSSVCLANCLSIHRKP